MACTTSPHRPDRGRAVSILREPSTLNTAPWSRPVYTSGKSRYIRHLAFGGYFERLAGKWYVEITPSYVFTSDSVQPYRYEADLLSGIKLLDHNNTLLSQLHLSVDLLPRKADLVHSDYPFLRFGELLDVCTPCGVNDKEWLSHEDLDFSTDGLDALSKLPLLSQ